MIICRKYFRIILLLAAFSWPLSAASDVSDSLAALLRQDQPDTSKVNLLNALSKSYFNSDPAEATRQGELAKSLAVKIKYNKGIALAYKQIGISHYLQGNYIDAINNWQNALKVY